MSSRAALTAFLALFMAAVVAMSAFADDQDDSGQPPAAEATPPPSPPPPPKTIKELEQEIEALKQRLNTLESQAPSQPPANVKQLDWDPQRDGARIGDKLFATFHGEFRSRALVEANTKNAYTNFAGERVYAYDPHSTLENDYGWWDQRLLASAIVNFGSTVDLIAAIQFGDIVWGSHSPALGGHGQEKFDQVLPFFRELYVRLSMDPIPAYLVFGHLPLDFLGNRIAIGNEHDGAYTYAGPSWLRVGFGAVRQYEGENVEMKLKTNDDEDTFFAWIEGKPAARQKIQAFGWCADWKVAQYPNRPDPDSPLYLLPAFNQKAYASQESQQWNIGLNWVGDFGPVTVNLEADQQFGNILANGDVDGAENIDFEGYAAFAKTDWRITSKDRLALTMAYGSGDDPRTTDYEGYFAPDNDFRIRDYGMEESIDRGAFMVYTSLSPGAGVPGMLKENLGTGGVENTVFANLGADLGFQDNHHYYVSYGYIRAARPNPQTDDADIGWEFDARVDYLFSNNVVFAIYGGHLFMTGDYFRRNAHDAAQVYFEWKLIW